MKRALPFPFSLPTSPRVAVVLIGLLAATCTHSLFAQEEVPTPPPAGTTGARGPGQGRAGARGPAGRGARGPRPPRPPESLQTKMLDYYDLEDIPLPAGAANTDGVAIMPDGRIAVCFQAGQVYFYQPKTKEWKLFAEGLHWPLGLLPVSNTELLVMQTPELTLLADRDGDGKAEVFKTISDDFGMSGNYAEFQAGPVRDAQGNLFYSLGTGSNMGRPLTNEVRGYYSSHGAIGRMTSPVPYRGWVMKVTPEGKTIPWAVGMREPNGLGFDPQGRLFAIDNQGDWVGTSALYHIEQGHFYGHAPELVWREDFQGGKLPVDEPVENLDKLRTRAAVVFPYGDMSNSPTQPLWDQTGGKFGPFAGQMFIGEMNYRRLMRVMLEDVDGQVQGAVSPFVDDPRLHLGNVRLAFDAEGSLWIGQTFHQAWIGESGFQRLKWKGIVPLEVAAMKLTEDGFDLTFTRPVKAETAARPEAYAMKTYFYNYHEAYGSSKYDLHDVKINSVDVSPDRLHAKLHLDKLEAWRVYDTKLEGIATDDGHEMVNPWVVYNLNHLLHDTPPPRAPIPNEKPARRPEAMPASGGKVIKGVGGPQDFKPGT